MAVTDPLSSADFAALAAGDPTASIVDTLIAGQYHKRTTMLRALLDLARAHRPDTSATLETAYALLAAVQAMDPAPVRLVLTDPGVGMWLASCLRRLVRAAAGPADEDLDRDVAHLASVAAATAIRAGHPFRIGVPVRDGGVMLPTLGRADAADHRTATVTLAVGGGATVEAGDDVILVPADPTDDGPGWAGLRRLRTRVGCTAVAVDLDDVGPDRGSDADLPATRLDAAATASWQSMLDGSWAVLVTQYPRRAGALGAGLRRFVPLAARGNGTGASVTSRDGFGGVALTPPVDPLRFADTLIHEFHHSLLYALTDLVPLHTADRQAVHYSPWRDDPRPLDGLLHGAYAYLGVVDFWRGQRAARTGSERLLADYEFARWRCQVGQAARVLLESGTLTAAGIEFVKGMTATAAGWLELPVDTDAQRLADCTVADHLIRWRLRHRRPDPEAVTAIAAAWQAGRPSPIGPATVAGRVAPHAPGLPLARRSGPALTAVRMGDSRAVDDVAPADRALIDGDLDTAQRRFLSAIESDPDDLENWAGLALCRHGDAALRVAPDVVRAVALRVGRVDPDALDRWMTRVPAARVA